MELGDIDYRVTEKGNDRDFQATQQIKYLLGSSGQCRTLPVLDMARLIGHDALQTAGYRKIVE